MKNKWIWVGVAGTLGFLLLFAVSVFIAAAVLGGKHLVVGSGVGLVEVKGLIVDSQEIVKQLHDFGKDDRVKAVVLRIDSPGGVVGPSQEICAEVKKLAAGKKVVVSMGSIAASGGYYIAAPASLILANPGTITGSIGVLMRFSNLEGLMGKIGMKAFTLKTGKFKDVGSPVRPMTEQEKAMLQNVIDNTHGQFVKTVAEGRKLPVADVRAIADGRIFTGEQALALKLVDRLGTFQDAIEEAGRLAGIKGEPELIRPPKKRKLLLEMLAEETATRIGIIARQENEFSVNYELEGAGR
ncbi:MAG TPA: signal peptide peptidase SppA [Geobacteraceae bacterium]